MSDCYILEGHEPIACPDIISWGKWFENAQRHVAVEHVGGVRISTVFLGIDHQFLDGPPLLFETMVFGGALDQEQERCSTWKQAEQMHATMVKRVRASVQ